MPEPSTQLSMMRGEAAVATEDESGILLEAQGGAKKTSLTAPPWCLPLSAFRIKWDTLLFVLITVQSVTSPYRIAIEYESFGLQLVDLLVDLIFVLDIYLNFKFAFFVDKDGARVVVVDPALISAHYKYSREFACALLACVPLILDLATLNATDSKLIVVVLLRMVRLAFIFRTFETLRLALEGKGVVITQSMFRMLVIIHSIGIIGLIFMGCAYYFLACNPWEPDCVYAEGNATAVVIWPDGDRDVMDIRDPVSRFLRSSYYSMQTLFTIGFGDSVAPVSQAEIIFACLYMYIGEFAYALIIANMTSLMSNTDVIYMRFKQEMDVLNDYMHNRMTPEGMRHRVKDYFEYEYQKQYGMLEDQILSGFSPHLHKEIMAQYMRFLCKVPYFAHAYRPERFIMAAASEMHNRTYTPNATMMYQNEKQRELIVVTRGNAEMFTRSNEQAFSTLLPGDFVGDYQLIFGYPNDFTVRANPAKFVEALVLDFPGLRKATADFDDQVSVSTDDVGARETINMHFQRSERFTLLKESMKKTTSNKKVMAMMEMEIVNNNNFVIEPSSKFHTYWDILKIASLAYLSVMIPERIRLQYGCSRNIDDNGCSSYNDDDGSMWHMDIILDFMVDLLFIVDILLNYKAFAFEEIGEDGRDLLNSNPEAIAERYKKSVRFIIDVAASVPFDIFGIIPAIGRYSLLRLTHLVRIALFPKFLSELQEHLEKGRDISIKGDTLSFVSIIFSSFVIFHWTAVVWSMMHFNGNNYHTSLYWVVTTFTTVGYGDVTPNNDNETGFALLIGFIGAIFAAALVAILTSYVHAIDLSENNVHHQKKVLKRFLGTRGVKAELQEKVALYYEFLENEKKGLDEMKLLKTALPSHLEAEFILFSTHQLVLNVPMFAACDSSFLRALMLSLEPRFYISQEWVVQGREPVEGMFFVGIGSVDITDVKSKKLLLKHAHGAFFGDETIIRRRRKAPVSEEELKPTYAARATTESELWFLDPSDFDQVLRENPKNTLRLDMLAATTEASRGGSERGETGDSTDPSRRFAAAAGAVGQALKGEHKMIIHPLSGAASIWRLVVFGFIMFDVFMIPYRIAFSNGPHDRSILNPSDFSESLYVDFAGDIIFFIDMILRSCVIAYFENDDLIEDRGRIFKHYARSLESKVHFMAFLPIEAVLYPILIDGTRNMISVQLLSVCRVNKLFRLFEVATLVAQLERALADLGLKWSKNGMWVTKVMMAMLLASHIFGCFFFLVARVAHLNGNPNWADGLGVLVECDLGKRAGTCYEEPAGVSIASSAALNASHANGTSVDAPTQNGGDQLAQYIISLYWAVATLTTVGYGDVSANLDNENEIFYCIVTMVVGTFVIYTMVIVNLEEIVAQLDVTQSIFKRISDHVKEYLIVQDVPEEIRRKAENYLDRLWVTQHGIGGTNLLNYLPPSLKCQVVGEMVSDRVRKLFFVKDQHTSFRKLFFSSLGLEHYMPGDFLFMAGEPAVTLFMLVDGSIDLTDESNTTVYTTLDPMSVQGCIGEGEFFSRLSQPCSACVKEAAELYTLEFDVFWRLLEQRRMTTAFRQALAENADALDKASTATLITKLKANLKNNKMAKMMQDNVVEKEAFVVLPSSTFFKVWKCVALIFALFYTIMIPFAVFEYELRFGKHTGDDDADVNRPVELWRIIVDCVGIAFFIVDMGLHLRYFVYKREGALVTKPAEFRNLYIWHGGFFLDLVSNLPLAQIYLLANVDDSRLYFGLSLLQFCRITRIPLYFEVFMTSLEELLGFRISSTGLRRLVFFVPILVVMNHIFACAFYLTGTYSDGEGSSGCEGQGCWDCWLDSEITVPADDDEEAQSGDSGQADIQPISEAPMQIKYLQAFYWALYTLTTTGYGSVALYSTTERFLALVAMVAGGVVCDAGITSILTALLDEKDRQSATNKRRTECTKKYLQNSMLDTSMKQQVLNYFNYVDEELHNLNDMAVLSCLSRSLQSEIASHFCYACLRASHMFKHYPEGVVRHLIKHMKPYIAIPNERLLCGSTTDRVLYVVIRGRVHSTNITGGTEALAPGSLISNIENEARSTATGPLARHVSVKVCSATGLPQAASVGTPDSYVQLDFGVKTFRTSIRKATRHPKWNETFDVRLPNSVDSFTATITHSSNSEHLPLGRVKVELGKTSQGGDSEPVAPKDYMISDLGGKGNSSGTLKVSHIVVELQPWERHEITETTVTADSFAHLYQLDLVTCKTVALYLEKVDLPEVQLRLPRLRKLPLNEAQNSRIVQRVREGAMKADGEAGGEHTGGTIASAGATSTKGAEPDAEHEDPELLGWRELQAGVTQRENLLAEDLMSAAKVVEDDRATEEDFFHSKEDEKFMSVCVSPSGEGDQHAFAKYISETFGSHHEHHDGEEGSKAGMCERLRRKVMPA